MSSEAASLDPAVRGTVRHLLQAAGRDDTVAFHAIVEQLLADGWSHGAIVEIHLAGVEQEVGRRWQEGRWTVAQEHAATAIVDDELARLTADLPQPSLEVEVMVVCAEGEWHVTPARMAALLLRERGFRVRFVGGSVPADELDRTLAEAAPDFIAVSCTYPLALAGAARVATVANRHGIVTLAGGAGFGSSPHRALRLGLSGWAGSVLEGTERLGRWRDRPPPIRAVTGPTVDLDALEDRWRAMADEVVARLRAAEGASLTDGQPITPLREDITQLLQAAHLTALCEDPTLFTDHLDRLRSSARPRGLPVEAIPPTIEILRQLVGVYEPEDVDAHAQLDAVIRSHVPSVADAPPVPGRSAMIARTLIEVEDPDLLRQRLLSLATELVEGCDHVGLLVLDRSEPDTSAPSSPLAGQVERIERELGEGPCLAAITEQVLVESADLGVEERWPDFRRAVVEDTPIRSLLAIPLVIRGRTIGVLELLAEQVEAFDQHDRSVAADFAVHAAIALHAAIEQRTLTEAVGTRDLIGQAKGILMEREGIDGERAFALLRTVSNQTNTKLRDVAAHIVRYSGG